MSPVSRVANKAAGIIRRKYRARLSSFAGEAASAAGPSNKFPAPSRTDKDPRCVGRAITYGFSSACGAAYRAINDSPGILTRFPRDRLDIGG